MFICLLFLHSQDIHVSLFNFFVCFWFCEFFINDFSRYGFPNEKELLFTQLNEKQFRYDIKPSDSEPSALEI